MKIDVIISTYNNPEAIIQILSRLECGNLLPNSISIADDGSSDAHVSRLKKFLKTLTIDAKYHWHEDKGFRKCKILNEAIRKSSSNYIVLLDGDCLPHKKFVQDHRGMAENGFFVQGRRCFVREKNVKPLLEGKKSLTRLLITGKISGLLKSFRLPIPVIKRNSSMYGLLGCNLGIWRKDLLSINGFDEDYEGWGREDSDLGVRLYNLGLQRKMVYGRSVVYHLNHPENSRGNLEINDLRLKKTIESKRIRCKNGIIKD